MSDNDFIWRFTPSRTDPELLEAIFVQREPLLVDLLERVAESATTASKHHVLLIGPRGFGKTHLITLLNHRLSKDAAMSDRIRVAWLLEDETITSFVQLLKRIYEVLAQQYPSEFPLDWLQDLLTESPKRIREQLETRLIESFASRTLLLCIENLDILFSGLGTSGQHDWRAFLQEHPFTTIIASTQRLFADVKSREKPFFGFFSPVPLEPLSVNDAVELLQRVAANRKATDLVSFLHSAEGRSRVRALHHLAGGNHRIYVVLSGFISRDSLDELVGPFQKMADDLTPYYQERLRWLSPQQRQIIEYLCSQDYSCIPKQIARQLLATESTISGQLKKLLEIGYVLRSEAGRESRYELAEPLMRLASEVKEQQRRPLQLLVNFLRVWYRPEALPELMHRAGTDSLRRHIAAAMEASGTSPDPRLRILDDAIAKARAENREQELLDTLEERAVTTSLAQDWYHLAHAQSKKTALLEAAIISCDRSLEIDTANAKAWTLKGNMLKNLKRYEEGISCYDRAIAIDSNFAWPWNNKGNSLNGLKRYEESIACYDRAIAIDSDYANPWNNKGNSLLDLKRYDEAIVCYDRAIEIDPNSAMPWNNKANSLHDLKLHEEAVVCYDRAIELDPNNAIPWSNKGSSLHSLKRYDAAIACFERAIRLDPTCGWPVFNRAEVCFGMLRFHEGLADLRYALEKFGVCEADDVASSVFALRPAFQQGDVGVVTQFADLHVEFNATVHLGNGLVRSLAKIDMGTTTPASLLKWRDFWTGWGKPHAEMQVPLRLFSAGVEYLIKQDPKVLLDLVLSERQIVAQVLEIETP